MKLCMVGCSHRNAALEIRERLAFGKQQTGEALEAWRSDFPEAELVLLSTCNRVELYFASERAEQCPTHHDVVEFLARFHGLDAIEVFDELFERRGDDAVRHPPQRVPFGKRLLMVGGASMQSGKWLHLEEIALPLQR